MASTTYTFAEYLTLGENSVWVGQAMNSPDCRAGHFAGGSVSRGWQGPPDRQHSLDSKKIASLGVEIVQLYDRVREWAQRSERRHVLFAIATDPMSAFEPPEVLHIFVQDHSRRGAPLVLNANAGIEDVVAVCPLPRTRFCGRPLATWGKRWTNDAEEVIGNTVNFLDQWVSSDLSVEVTMNRRNEPCRWRVLDRHGRISWDVKRVSLRSMWSAEIRTTMTWGK